MQLGVDDLRRDPLEVRKATLEMVLASAGPGIRYNEHIDGDAEDIFRHACQLRLEGIVSKLRRSPYRSGRSPHWIKMKNPDCDAVRRDRRGLGAKANEGATMTMRALVSADQPLVRIWHPPGRSEAVRRDLVRDPGSHQPALEQLNSMSKYATGLEFGEDA